MFNREELLYIYTNMTGEKFLHKAENLLYKIENMLFVNSEIVENIKEEFKNNNLVKIEKSDNTNEYYIHFIGDSDTVDLVEKAVKIQFKDQYTKDFLPEINVITHDNKESMWWHNDMIQVWDSI